MIISSFNRRAAPVHTGHSSFLMVSSRLLLQFLSVVACFGGFLLSRMWNAANLGSIFGQSKTFHTVSMMKSFVDLVVCCGSLACCNYEVPGAEFLCMLADGHLGSCVNPFFSFSIPLVEIILYTYNVWLSLLYQQSIWFLKHVWNRSPPC